MMSLVHSAKLNAHEPHAYLKTSCSACRRSRPAVSTSCCRIAGNRCRPKRLTDPFKTEWPDALPSAALRDHFASRGNAKRIARLSDAREAVPWFSPSNIVRVTCTFNGFMFDSRAASSLALSTSRARLMGRASRSLSLPLYCSSLPEVIRIRKFIFWACARFVNALSSSSISRLFHQIEGLDSTYVENAPVFRSSVRSAKSPPYE
jgi:hypothetical protein